MFSGLYVSLGIANDNTLLTAEPNAAKEFLTHVQMDGVSDGLTNRELDNALTCTAAEMVHEHL